MKQCIICKIDKDETEHQQGEQIHSFLYGWQRYYGTEWIGEDLYWFLKIKGL